MAEDEFYVDDESPDEVRANWRAGEKGATSGSRDLNQRAQSIVERAVRSIEEPAPPETITVDTSDWFGVDPRPQVESTTDTTTRGEAPVNA